MSKIRFHIQYGLTSDLVTESNKYIFVTEVGSRMWGMEHFASDFDLFHVYQTPAIEYLITGNFGSTRAANIHIDDEGREIDSQYMEIGHLVNLLKKGNINAIWAVCSGVVHKDTEILRQLKHITLQNLSKATYESCRGMAISQLRDAEKRKEVKDPQKSMTTCRRTQLFGMNLLLGSGACFCPMFPTGPMTVEICEQGFEDLKTALEISTIPDKPNPMYFDGFIYRLRMQEILDNNISLEIVGGM